MSTEIQDCVEHLSCALTEEEVAKYSQEMAELNQRKVEVEAEKKEKMKDYGAKLQHLESGVNVLGRKVITKKEARDVNCFWEFNFDEGEKVLYRKDTGERVKGETISAMERQRHMEFIESKNENGEMSQAVKKAEDKKAEKKEKKPEPEKEQAVEGLAEQAEETKQHIADNAKNIMESVAGSEGTEEAEGEPGHEESSDGPDEAKEEGEPASDDAPEDCFGTFVDDDPECGNCDRVKDCSEATPPPEAVEEEETPVEAAEVPKDEGEKTHTYTCAQCGEGFDEPKDVEEDGIDNSACSICGATNWY
jgi:hypothetical protein